MSLKININGSLSRVLCIMALLLNSATLQAQPEKKLLTDNQLMRQCLQQTRFDIDTSAQAVILYEKGDAIMNEGEISLRIERIVKILGTEAIDDFGTIELAKGRDAKVINIEATTYNLEGAQITEQSIKRADIFKDKLEKGIVLSKFNLPSLKAGSVIHYSFTISQPGYSIPDWAFQNSHPTLYSAYEINIPEYIIYTAIQRVNVTCTPAKKKKELETCASCSFTESYGKNQPVYSTWVRRNIPAFKEEPYMSSSNNYVEQVKIRITAVNENGLVRNLYKNWDEYSKKFYYKDNKSCGQVYDNNNFLKEKVEELTQGKTSELDKAKAIFNYVRSDIRRKAGNSRDADIKDVFTARQGDLTGINLLLTAMLRKAGLNSAPVLLATKREERLNQFFPDGQNIDYLVSKVTADRKDYFLDASGKYMPFGTLPTACYNGYCRVITEKGDFAELSPDSIKNRTVVIATLAPTAEKDKLSLKIDYQFGLISSMRYRKSWIEDSSKLKADLVKDMKTANPSVLQPTLTFLNPDRPDELLKLRYEANLELDVNANMIYFNPYFDKFFSQNPFSANSRTYPVEMDYISDMIYILKFSLPANYTIDDYPKSALIQLGSSNLLSMKNIMNYDEAGREFSINSRFSTQSTFFGPEGYKELRTFFDHVIEEQSKKIVLKKLP